jgi:hypothetical protein
MKIQNDNVLNLSATPAAASVARACCCPSSRGLLAAAVIGADMFLAPAALLVTTVLIFLGAFGSSYCIAEPGGSRRSSPADNQLYYGRGDLPAFPNALRRPAPA